MLRIRYYGETNVGLKRTNNEDNYYVNGDIRSYVTTKISRTSGSCSAKKALFAVCDGMGGDSSGEEASLEAVNCLFPAEYAKIAESADYAIRTANSNICAKITEFGKRRGTTLAALYIADSKAVCCNVGDSRVYLFRNNTLTRLSIDHSKAQSLINIGAVTEEQARSMKGGHELSQYLGIFEHEMVIQPYFSAPVDIMDDDRFLVCSDGLTDMLSDQEISALMSASDDPHKLTDALISAALDKGGHDNVTVVVLSAKESSAFIDKLFRR